MYYHGDDTGNLDPSRPFTDSEHVEAYWAIVDDDPTALADLYLGFHDFNRVEFLLFKDRLSAAILVARSAMKANSELDARFEQRRKDGSHLVPGWEAESDGALDESIGVVHGAQEIAVGAAILTAVAALELLLKELSSTTSRQSGLDQTLRDFLQQRNVSPDKESDIIEMASAVRKRRNFFAHSLTGSYWDQTRASDMFTPESMDDTLFTVARIAIALEMLVD